MYTYIYIYIYVQLCIIIHIYIYIYIWRERERDIHIYIDIDRRSGDTKRHATARTVVEGHLGMQGSVWQCTLRRGRSDVI